MERCKDGQYWRMVDATGHGCDQNPYTDRVDRGQLASSHARSVRQLRQRIYTASRQEDYRKVRSLQRLMLRSHAHRRLAVRRVTQQGSGRVTAGVDKLGVKTLSGSGEPDG
ncbi:hypothetical protein NKDENANG_04167 [Candidatus Entotheonellaceae bacterium PAL068K]